MVGRKSKELNTQHDIRDLLESADDQEHPTVLGYFEKFGSEGMKDTGVIDLEYVAMCCMFLLCIFTILNIWSLCSMFMQVYIS
jgi:hypothetical protein